ncbi:MAG: hypothetical protein CME25_04100 [Gemmatimonadetes bacterium]|nr:hypothetical protein [Gemmatimonadota bacterium]
MPIGQGNTISGCARSQNGVGALNERFGDLNSFQAFDVTARDQVNDWVENVILPSTLFTPLSFPVSVTRPPAEVFRQLYTSIERTKEFCRILHTDGLLTEKNPLPKLVRSW